MLDQSTGFQIYNSNLYNVGGNLNLQTRYNPPIQGHLAARRSPTDSGFGTAGSHPSLPIQHREMRHAAPQLRRYMLGADIHGAARNMSHSSAGSLRQGPSGMSSNNPDPSSSSWNSLIVPDGRIPIPTIPIPQFNSTSSSFPFTNPWFPTFDAQSQYPATNPYSANTTAGPSSSFFGGTFFSAANVNFYNRRRRWMEDQSLLTQRKTKLRRQGGDGIEIIRSEDIKLIGEIGSGPGYFLHVGRNEGHAIIVRVFNKSPIVRQQLESTVALSKGLMHPNVLHIKGISARKSKIHFIAYEGVHCNNAEGLLAAALKHDLEQSIALGFKMIAGLAAGMNHLCVQGVSLKSMGVENFDVFLDVDGRFLMSISPRLPNYRVEYQESQEDWSWHVFNALCQKVLLSANRVLHVDREEMDRHPATLDSLRASSSSAAASRVSLGSAPSLESIQDEERLVAPRREYVWRTIDRGEQSLATVARRIKLDLDMNQPPLHRLTRMNGRHPHRCPGYVREEITLATTTRDSAVVTYDAPSPLEICSICREVVGLNEAFECICGDPTPGSRRTIKCQTCKFWSHSDCNTGNTKKFTCRLCAEEPPLMPPPLEDSRLYFPNVAFESPPPPLVDAYPTYHVGDLNVTTVMKAG
ncbi:hypothetical protein B0H19DRAFT_1260694 [Mycena capillaripes]|nr:hypothetical protein B0H19DRAFT_1260694 [Mycena capillaripes]